jgi:transposase
MKFIQGTNRDQTYLFPVSLEESIGQDNVVRAVDIFVESLPFQELGFKMDFVENGRPAYHPKDLLKLFLYGYLNRTRSSRELEKECKRNIEVMWLLKGLQHIDQNRKNVKQKETLYKRRQAIVEHPYGTVKRQWGFSYIMTKKGKQRASADVGLMFTAYNLRRLLTILGLQGLLTTLLTGCSYLFAQINLIRLKMRHFNPLEIFIKIFSPSETTYLKVAYICAMRGRILGF